MSELRRIVPTPAPRAHHQLADLNREHLAIAQGYMRAANVVRTAVEILLTDQPEHAARAEDLAAFIVARAHEGPVRLRGGL